MELKQPPRPHTQHAKQTLYTFTDEFTVIYVYIYAKNRKRGHSGLRHYISNYMEAWKRNHIYNRQVLSMHGILYLKGFQLKLPIEL
jgi:hypothetical protein